MNEQTTADLIAEVERARTERRSAGDPVHWTRVPLGYVRASHASTGGHWFDRDTLDYFGTILPANAWTADADVRPGVARLRFAMFVTSEQPITPGYDVPPRAWTIRLHVWDPTYLDDSTEGRNYWCSDIGGFREHDSLLRANEAARRVRRDWTTVDLDDFLTHDHIDPTTRWSHR